MVYMGSKARLAKYIIPIINHLIKVNNCDTFIDGFVGGGNIIANPKYNIECKNKYGFDNNKYLIALLNKMKKYNFDFIEVSEEEYKDIRNNKEKHEYWYLGYVGFCFSFAGKFFDTYARGKDSKGNVRKMGKERYNNLKKQYNALQECTLFCEDFFNIKIDKVKRNSLIYLDPPYQDTSKYSKDNNIEDYTKFWDIVRKLSEKCIVLISEYNAPDDFECIYEHTPLKISLNNANLDENMTRKENIEKLWAIKNRWWKD